MPLREAVSLIRGKKGTKVHLTVLRQGDETQRFPLAIVRDKIDLAEQAASLRFETRERNGKPFKLAIIDLPSFYGDSDPGQRQCTDDVEKLLEQVKEAKADGLLLDLSRNGGGLLEHAVKISGFFIRKGEVVGVENARRQMSVLSDRDERILYTGPMVVHVSRVSASASEILAGALKDYHRAVITGDDHTFGKGTVQTVTPLPPGLGALKITTARFFRPGGQSTQNDGVSADVVIPSLLATDDLGEKNQPFALAGESRLPLYGSFANAIGPTDFDSQVSGAELAELVRSSSERVAKSAEFEEVRDEARRGARARGHRAARRHHQGARGIEGGRREEATARKGDGNGAKPDARRPPTRSATTKTAKAEPEDEHDPQVQEAVEVLADLVALTQPRSRDPRRWRAAGSEPVPIQILSSPSAADDTARDLERAIARRSRTPRVEVRANSAGHFEIRVVSASFAQQSRVVQQQRVYAAIAHLMKGDAAPVHAIDRLGHRDRAGPVKLLPLALVPPLLETLLPSGASRSSRERRQSVRRELCSGELDLNPSRLLDSRACSRGVSGLVVEHHDVLPAASATRGNQPFPLPPRRERARSRRARCTRSRPRARRARRSREARVRGRGRPRTRRGTRRRRRSCRARATRGLR